MSFWDKVLKGIPVVGQVAEMVGDNADRKAKKKENNDQRAFEERMWNMTNEYNSPLNQRKRMESAGYNPVASGQMPNPVSADVPNITPKTNTDVGRGKVWGSAINDTYTNYMNNRMQEEQINLTRSKATESNSKVLTDAQDRAYKESQTAKTYAEKRRLEKDLEYYDELKTQEIEGMRLRNIAQTLRNSDLPAEIVRNAEKHVDDIANSASLRNLRTLQEKGILQNMEESKKRILAIEVLNKLRTQQLGLNAINLKEAEVHGANNPMRKDPWTRTILNVVRGLGFDDVADVLEK